MRLIVSYIKTYHMEHNLLSFFTNKMTLRNWNLVIAKKGVMK